MRKDPVQNPCALRLDAVVDVCIPEFLVAFELSQRALVELVDAFRGLKVCDRAAREGQSFLANLAKLCQLQFVPFTFSMGLNMQEIGAYRQHT